MENHNDPKRIMGEYQHAVNYKNQLGVRGLYEQNKINERFMVGDQWHGAKCGADRPLVRHNVIKRIQHGGGGFSSECRQLFGRRCS